MPNTMEDDSRQKTGKVIARHTGPRRHEPPDRETDRRMQDVYVRLKANRGDGPYASRRIANAAHGITKPHRPLARILRDARRAGCLDEVMKAITKTLYQAAMRDSAA